MAEIKWIKITTNIFDDEKILLIESMPDADAIIVIWFKLLVLAGKTNNCGILTITDTMPYNDEMLATIFRRPIATVRLALKVFEQFGMIEIVNDTICIPKWEIHQNIEGMERIREQSRNRMRDYRARKKLGITSVGENCVYCGQPANTVDHIIPKSKGGEDVEWNLVPCCKSCNSSKKDKDLAEFLNDSFFYEHQNIDHKLVRSNSKLMKLVAWDESAKRYVTVTQSYALDKDKDKDKNKNKNKKERGRFTPPTLSEVQAYINEKGYHINAEAYISFYESKGWMIGKNKMKDWKQAVVTWEGRWKEEHGGTDNRYSEQNNGADKEPEGWDNIFGRG